MVTRVVALVALTAAVVAVASADAVLSFGYFVVGCVLTASAMTVAAAWRQVPPPRTRQLVRRFGTLGALLVVGLTATVAIPGRLEERDRIRVGALRSIVPEPEDKLDPIAPTALFDKFSSGWLGNLFTALVTIAAVAALAWALLRERPAREVFEEDSGVGATWATTGPAVAAALDELRIDASTPDDRRRAVINAYVALERTLEAHGHPRLPSETASEFVGRVLAAGELLDPRAVDGLLAVFNRARFSDLEVTDEDVRTARAHLGALGVR